MSSFHFHDEEWAIAIQAQEECYARAVAENRTYTRDEIIARMRELGNWRARALRAEAKLRAAARASTPDKPNGAQPPARDCTPLSQNPHARAAARPPETPE